MTIERKERRKKVVYMTDELLTFLFSHPDNYYVHQGFPEGTDFVRAFNEPSRMAVGFILQNDDWEIVREGEEFPIFEVEVRKINCIRCSQKMMYDEENGSQYCPNCQYVWHP
jgi:hypothetical protein